MNRIVCLSRPVVKPTRRTGRSAVPFGAGILATSPTYRAPVSFADLEWHAAQAAAAEDRRFDALAADAEAQDRIERGCLL